MKFKARTLSCLLILILQFILNGCSDDFIQQTNNITPFTVSGKILNLVNQGTPETEVLIMNMSTFTSKNGIFSFENIYPPFPLQVIDKNSIRTLNFYGITSSEITIPGIQYIDDTLNCTINVSYPPEIVMPGVEGKIIFTDGNYINSYDMFPSNHLNVLMTDYLPVTGKLILLTYKKNGSGKIVSYENFGESSPF